ncbi:hypothetical protein BDQ12DRAFT_729297 [Crucibulum laeve]|uniref:Uncharacterized protein n=1 Tax=Crucibulum laeve TaxID=68775 RepID=A0A5C3LF52_9AGAR|nr:hypothetical protein BDQ12DRAFT_729297 [Crucibulum laeve]
MTLLFRNIARDVKITLSFRHLSLPSSYPPQQKITALCTPPRKERCGTVSASLTDVASNATNAQILKCRRGAKIVANALIATSTPAPTPARRAPSTPLPSTLDLTAANTPIATSTPVPKPAKSTVAHSHLHLRRQHGRQPAVYARLHLDAGLANALHIL